MTESLSSVGRRTRANKELENGNDTDDDRRALLANGRLQCCGLHGETKSCPSLCVSSSLMRGFGAVLQDERRVRGFALSSIGDARAPLFPSSALVRSESFFRRSLPVATEPVPVIARGKPRLASPPTR